ncbi:MAG: ATP-binding protein [Calditrichia bacterium]
MKTTGKTPSVESLLQEIDHLNRRLAESEETLSAIQNGGIDALVLQSPKGEEQVYTLKGANYIYRVIFESINEGALILSLEGTILYANSSFKKMLNLKREFTLIGNSLPSYISPSDLQICQSILQQKAADNIREEVRLMSDHNKLIPVELSAKTVEVENERWICIIVTDLTERKKNEEERQSYIKKLEKINGELQNFAFIASHDLREPLRKIHIFANLVLEKYAANVGATAQDYLIRMQHSIKRMQDLLNALLKYSRIETQALPFKTVDLQDTVQNALSDLEIVLEETGGRVDVGKMPSIEAEPDQMRQLFQNLIENALIYIQENKNPQVKIHSEIVEGYCRIFVEDNGIGFNEKFTDRIFMPFERLHNRKDFRGTGMGLSICKKIAERHGGSITAKSRAGAGSTFIISLPVKNFPAA